MKNRGLIMALAALAVSCASEPPPEFDEAAWLERVKNTDISALHAPHRNEDGAFFNPWLPQSEVKRTNRKGFFFREKMKFPDFPAEQYAARDNDYAYLADPAANGISFAGHASIIIKIDGKTILTDPFFSNRAGGVTAKEVKIKFDFSKVPENAVVLISHDHYDHLDTPTIKKLIKRNAAFIVPLGLKEFFTKRGAKTVHELDWWRSATVNNITYTLVPAQHWSWRFAQKRNKTLWGGYIIEASKTFYFSGDTGYFRGFEEFGKRWKIDYALIGAGAYEPRWFMFYQHLNIAEFFRAADDLQAKTVIPMHFGVISLSDEPILYPLYEIETHIKANPQYAPRIKALRVGESLPIRPFL